jgi:asparagine N-glycosylation enzyme membrane subunit Stt3
MDASKYYKENEETGRGAEHHGSDEHHDHAHKQGSHHHTTESGRDGGIVHSQRPSNLKYRNQLSAVLGSRYFIILLAIMMFALAIYIRSGLLRYQGLFEPDGFFYYSYIRAIINNHLAFPRHLGISGFPWHNGLGEAPGLPYLTVIFYLVVGWSGIGYLTVMRLLPVLWVLLEMIVAYFIAKQLSNSRFLGLLAMFFVAISSGNVARTAALVYRGDTFISLPLMVGLYLFILGLKKESGKEVLLYSVAGAAVLSAGIMIWNGSPYAVAVYLLSVAMIVLYAFIKGSRQLSRKALIFAVGMIATYLLQNAYVALGAGNPGLLLQGNSFLVFYIPVLAIAVLAYFVIDRKVAFFGSAVKRAVFVLAAIAVIGIIVVVAFPNVVNNIAVASGVIAPQSTATNQSTTNQSSNANIAHAVGTTTQELQQPSYGFLFSSFGLQLYLAPIGVVAFILASAYIERKKKGPGFDSGALSAFIIMAVYFVVTSYLQYNAIRYNALISIPIAIFAAYGLYAVVRIVWDIDLEGKRWAPVVALVMLAVAAYIIYRSYVFASQGFSAKSLLFAGGGTAMIILGVALVVHTLITVITGRLRLRVLAAVAVAVILIFGTAYSIAESFGSVQADGINPQFLGAMTWMKNNTPTNSTVLALWPDGSVVEAWANRTSYMDSVGGENGTRIYYFARFLANTSSDGNYLYSIGKPDYLVSRQYWMAELEGLLTEGIPSNISTYSYVALYPTSIKHNATASFYLFQNQYYNVTVVSNQQANGMSYNGYVSANGGPYTLLGRVVFYNTSSALYSTVNATGQAADYTYVVFFSGNLISGGMLLTDQLYNSNLFKLVYLCNRVECPYNANSNVVLQAVYMNNDTKIFRISYR